MKVVGYLTLDPEGDRPYFSGRPPPKELEGSMRLRGVRVFQFVVNVPIEESRVEEAPCLIEERVI